MDGIISKESACIALLVFSRVKSGGFINLKVCKKVTVLDGIGTDFILKANRENASTHRFVTAGPWCCACRRAASTPARALPRGRPVRRTPRCTSPSTASARPTSWPGARRRRSGAGDRAPSSCRSWKKTDGENWLKLVRSSKVRPPKDGMIVFG